MEALAELLLGNLPSQLQSGKMSIEVSFTTTIAAIQNETFLRTQREHTIEDLLPGVEYFARVSVYKEFEGVIYRSKPVTLDFKTDTD